MPKLIILRGNSGSGKATIAKEIWQEYDGHFTGYGAQGNFEGNRWSHNRGITSYVGAFSLWEKS